MDLDDVRHLVHRQGFQVARSLVQEFRLVHQDLLRDGENRSLSLVERLDEGAALAELVAQVSAQLPVRAGSQDVLVGFRNPKPGEVLVGQDRLPSSFLVLLERHVGNDVGIAGWVEGGARRRIELRDVFRSLGHLIDGGVERLRVLRVVLPRQGLEVGIRDAVFE